MVDIKVLWVTVFKTVFHLTWKIEIICADMFRSPQTYSTLFTRIFCSKLLDLTLVSFQVISQGLVLIQNSDYNNDNNVTIQTNGNITDHECMWSKSNLLYFCSHDCWDLFIWIWLKLSSHCKLFTSCERQRQQIMIGIPFFDLQVYKSCSHTPSFI